MTGQAAPRIGSLCSGYGGLDLGLMSVVGGAVAWHVEYDKHPSAVLDARFPGVPNYGDVTTTDWTQVEPVDWLTAGYPCQPFSSAGRRKGSADERHLWPAVADAIGVLRPRQLLLENVAGHLSLGLDAVLADLAALGYDATWGVVRAADAGAPHGRARLFIVASDTSRSGFADGIQRSDQARLAERAVAGAEHRNRDWSAAERVHIMGGSALLLAADGAATDTDVSTGTRNGVPERRDGQSAAERSGQTQPRRRRRSIADTDGAGRRGVAELNRGTAGRLDSEHRGHPDGRSDGVSWGPYAGAICRWEHITGRTAPAPTEPGTRGQQRLSPRFVEWLMGLSEGWVTDILLRNPALKCIGNGVVPQQAALALRLLLPICEVAA